ncbi:hypothetical protein HMPREF9511_00545 [Enterococcus faecalis TX0630]|uniref:Uncharacterized protein n=1 Tax=Enterococcus faecalis TX0630 TaxID=749508 RepID=A0ABC9P8U6_ENTFL|nr:hypothetical protein HMPREF9512_00194 [Enterococcus faecalis EnGen0311]EFU91363.1 hypothetical protein HMPREF9511_00545 [Enterococcus faecalis TX0630]
MKYIETRGIQSKKTIFKYFCMFNIQLLEKRQNCRFFIFIRES